MANILKRVLNYQTQKGKNKNKIKWKIKNREKSPGGIAVTTSQKDEDDKERKKEAIKLFQKRNNLTLNKKREKNEMEKSCKIFRILKSFVFSCARFITSTIIFPKN